MINAKTSAQPKGTPAWFRWCLVFVASVMMAISILATVFLLHRAQLRREINARIAAVRAAGLPINWDELSRWPSVVPDSENGALIYTNAFAHIHFQIMATNEVYWAANGKSLSESNLALLFSEVHSNQQALDPLYSAAQYSKFRYPIDYGRGIDMVLPHLTGIKGAELLLEYAVIVASEKGDRVGAVRATKASFDLVRSLENEPLFSSQQVALALIPECSRDLERTLCRLSLDEATLAKFSEEIIKADSTNRMLTGLIGERALGAEFLRRFEDEPSRLYSSSTTQGKADSGMSTYVDACTRLIRPYEVDRNFQLRLMETNLLVYSTAPPLLLSRTNEFLALQKEAAQDDFTLSFTAFTGLRFAWRVVLAHANLRTALCGVAIERWRLAHGGSLPGSLAQLVPEFLPAIPQDPYNGEPLKFKKLPKGYLVYSVGPDLKDDGGKEKPPITNCPPYIVHDGYVIWLNELRPRNGKTKANPPVPYDVTFTVER